MRYQLPKICLAALSAMFLATSCNKVDSNDLKDEVPYYQQYSVTYDNDDNKTSASAEFRVRTSSGAKVELSGASNVTANGVKGSGSLTDKSKYTWNISGMPDVAFALSKGGTITINNTVSANSVGTVQITNLPDTLSKAKGFGFDWTGPALESGETMTANITSSSLVGGVTLFKKGVTSNHVEFSSTELQTVTTGDINIKLTRTRDLALQNSDNTAGGTISVSREMKTAANLKD
jgi:hypothetical protein